MNQVTSGLLRKGIEVKVLALSPTTTHLPVSQIPKAYIQETGLEVFPIDSRVKPVAAFLNLFTKRSYNISRFFCKKFKNRLEELLTNESFDIIQLEGLFLTPYIEVIRKCTGSPVLYRSHNIEHFIWERMAQAARNPIKKQYLNLLARRLKKYELKTMHQVDGLIAISPVDMHFFKLNGFNQPGVTIAVGADLELFQRKATKVHTNTVFHIGRMDWRPNHEGILWFLRHVWPLVIEANPELRFVLAGKKIPEVFYQFAGNHVQIAGEVPDAAEFIHAHQLMVVPLLSGGGMRVKIIEGMTAGKPIVSTSIGAEGINCLHGENILLADTEREMADSILFCFNNKHKMHQIGENAMTFAQQHHNTDVMINDLIRFYNTFLTA